MAFQQTIILIKPDGIQRGLVGEILSRFERKGLKIDGMKMFNMTDKILDKWYAHHKERDFFSELKSFMSWTPIVAIVLSGQQAVSSVRKIVGTTKGFEAEAGSIRGDFGMSGSNNLIHASDSVENAQKEIDLIFNKEELYSYSSAIDSLIYSKSEREG